MIEDRTATLQRRFRRLLSAYPVEHRQTYQAEMLGVLLDGAGPHRGRPTLAEAFDLLGGAFRYRSRQAGNDLTGRRWRDAAAVIAVVAPGAMLLIQVSALLGSQQVVQYLANRVGVFVGDPAARMGPSVWVPSLAWLVTLAALLGPRFAAIGLGWVAGMRLLGRRRLLILAAIGTFLVAGQVLYVVAAWSLPFWVGTIFWGTGSRAIAVLAGLVLLVGLDRSVRRRLLAVLVPLGVLALLESAVDVAYFGTPMRATLPVEAALLAVLTAATFVVSAGRVRRAERVRIGPTPAANR